MKLTNRLRQPEKKLLLVGTTIIALLLPTGARAEDACTPVVKACDRALADQDKVINLKTRAIETQQNIIDAQDKRLTKLEEGQSIFKSPLLYVIVGMVAGGYLVSRAK